MSYTKLYLAIAGLITMLATTAIVTNPIKIAIAQEPTTTTTTAANQSDINVDQKIILRTDTKYDLSKIVVRNSKR